jgi:hypothetical protein
MSIQINIKFLNACNPKFMKALNGSSQEQEEWQEDNGTFTDRPGAVIECDGDDGVYKTDDEYGGYVIELACIPEGTTHIAIYRS